MQELEEKARTLEEEKEVSKYSTFIEFWLD